MTQLKNKAKINYKELGTALTKESNFSVFDLLGKGLTVTKSQTPILGVSGTECTFTVIVTNTNALNSITDIVISDDLTTAGYTFVAGSVTVNGVANPGNIQTGITLTSLSPLAVHTVVFKATAN